MKALIQRVLQASVSVDNSLIAEIDQGLLVFLGVAHNDNQALADKLLSKVLNYRIFADAAGKMNLSLRDINAHMLIVSQFTLMADTAKGRRPSFTTAADPEKALFLYRYFVEQATCLYQQDRIKSGEFAADMQIDLINDGPVTFLLEVD